MSETLDSRELQEELNELERRDDPEQDDDPLDEEERERLEGLRELADAGISDWQYGAQLIPEDAFEDHARELAEETGAIDRDAAWPLSYIDWEAAADALQQDYTSVTFMGTDYFVRS